MENGDRSSQSPASLQQHPENRPFPFGSSYGGMGLLPQIGKGLGWPGAGGSWPGLKLPGAMPGFAGLAAQGMGGSLPGLAGGIPGMTGLMPGLGGPIPSLGSVPALKAMSSGNFPYEASSGASFPLGGQPGGAFQAGMPAPGSFPPAGYPSGGFTSPYPVGQLQPPPQSGGWPGPQAAPWPMSASGGMPAAAGAADGGGASPNAAGAAAAAGPGGNSPLSPEALAGLPPGFNEASLVGYLQSIDPNWVSKWQNYEGWPFTSPPFPIVADSAAGAGGPGEGWTAGMAADPFVSCAGDLQNPVCLQACLASILLRSRIQQQQISQMFLYMKSMDERLQQAESKPAYTIEKLEYNFDQLKVEQLDGTLNIGMTTPSESQMQEFGQLSVPQKVVNGGASVYPLPIPESSLKGTNAPGPPSPGAAAIVPASAPTPSQSFAATVIQPSVGANGNNTVTMQGSTVLPEVGAVPGHGPVPVSPPGFPSASMLGAPSGAAFPPGFSGPGFNGPAAAMPPGFGSFGGANPFPGSQVPGFSAVPPAADGIPPVPPGQTAPSPVAVPSAATGSLPGFGDVRASVDAYLNTLAQDAMSREAKALKLQMDPYHQKMVIEDVRRQIPERIRHYMADEQSKQQSLPPAERLEVRQLLRKASERTIRDAELALTAYVQNLAKHPKG